MIAGRKLLLADDSIAIQKVIDLTFTDEGMEVTTVGDGQDALEKLNQFTPDVVLADIFMPGVDGYELCKFIKENERFRGVPVMLLVGSFEPFDEAEAKRAGADDVVTKPFQSIRDLVSRVGSLVGHEDESANKYSMLGLNQTESERHEAESSRQEAGADTQESDLDTSSSTASTAEAPPADVISVSEAEAEDSDQPNVKVFVEAPLMETAEPPVAAAHTCPSDIELQTADTQQLEPVPEAAETSANAEAEFADTMELEVVDEGAVAVEENEPRESIGESLPLSAQDQVAQVEAVTFDEEGVLDLGDIDSFAAASEDDFELDIDVAPVMSLTEAAVLDNEPVLEQVAQPIDESSTPAINFEQISTPAGNLSPEAIEAISRRVVEQLSDRVVREIAWEVVPELSEMLIKQRLEEQN